MYAKPPFGGPQQVLKYLARYTHRVAISNRRLVALDADALYVPPDTRITVETGRSDTGP